MRKLAVAAAVVLTGCAPALKVVPVGVRWEPSMHLAAKQMEKGKNTINGSAFLRQAGGGVVTCAGSEVSLIPDTPYSRKRLSILYGNPDKGYRKHLSDYFGVTVDNAFESYDRYQHTTVCDAQGKFSFKNVADGSWFLQSEAIWTVPARIFIDSLQGGYMVDRIDVKGGETRDVIISR